jgi:hypothetical protein
VWGYSGDAGDFDWDASSHLTDSSESSQMSSCGSSRRAREKRNDEESARAHIT